VTLAAASSAAAAALMLVVSLTGCATPPAPVSRQPSSTPAAATEAAATEAAATDHAPTDVPGGASPDASVITIPAWGEVWASMPAWFALPADAILAPTTDQTLSFRTSLNPDEAIAAVDRILRPRDFSAESRDQGAGFQQVFYTWGADDTCELLVLAHVTEDGSQVDIRYPVTCPR
jgi:hypothetical protein